MNDDIVDRNSMAIVTLVGAGASIPDLNVSVFGASNHPFPLAVERYASDVAGVAFEGEDGIRVGRLDLVKLDVVVPGCS